MHNVAKRLAALHLILSLADVQKNKKEAGSKPDFGGSAEGKVVEQPNCSLGQQKQEPGYQHPRDTGNVEQPGHNHEQATVQDLHDGEQQQQQQQQELHQDCLEQPQIQLKRKLEPNIPAAQEAATDKTLDSTATQEGGSPKRLHLS